MERPPSICPPRGCVLFPGWDLEGNGEQRFSLSPSPGAQLTVDGNSSNLLQTPCFLQLSPGRHSLNVQLAGYRPYPKIFNVPQEREIFLQLTKAAGRLA